MSDLFDELTAGLFEGERPMDTHDGIHFYGATRNLIQQLGAWEIEDQARAESPAYAAFTDPDAADKISRQMDNREATMRMADQMIELGRDLGRRLNAWVQAKGLGTLCLYTVIPCCGMVQPVILNDGGPARFFDPELDETPVRPAD